jgi:hypothetical protein
MNSYQTTLERIRYIVKILDTESQYSKYIGSPSLWNSIQYYKLCINPQNKLQILISEATYLLKLISEYENEHLC